MDQAATATQDSIVIRGGNPWSIQRWVPREGEEDHRVIFIGRTSKDRFESYIGDPEYPVDRLEGTLDEVMVKLKLLPRIQGYYRALFILEKQTPETIREAGYTEYRITVEDE
jgi:hypothetical protein